jgi:hypothetical protein
MIATIGDWWTNLTAANRMFYVVAGFFSVIFIWQFIASMIGLTGGDLDIETDADVDFDADGVDGVESVAAFKMLSIRAILAFCTLFFWSGSLYLNMGKSMAVALMYSFGWGLGGWVVVTLLVNWMRRLAETGNVKLSTCVGLRGVVYMDIPAGGPGQVRVMVSRAMSMVRARSADGSELKAGTPVRVTRLLDSASVEVKPAEPQDKGKEGEE